jgi:hypothetical protein
MPVDIAGILDQVNSINEMSSGIAETTSNAAFAIADNNKNLDDSYKASEARQNETAAATKLVQSVHNFGQLAAQDAIQSFAAHAAPSDLEISLADTYNAAEKNKAEALAVINQKRSVSWMDDPIGWIQNKLTINDDINKYNGFVQQSNDAEDQIAATNRMVDQRASAIAKTQTTITAASAEAGAQVAANQALEAADLLHRQGIVANTAGVEAIQRLNYQQLQIAGNKLDADARYIQIQTAQKELAMRQESMDLEKQRMALSSKKEGEADAANEYITNSIRAGMKVLYPNNPKAWDIDTGKYTAMMSGKVPMDPKLLYAYTIGSTNNQLDPTGTQRILATSPAQMAQVMIYKPDLSPDAKTTASLIDKAVQVVQNDNQYKQMVAAKDTKGIEDMINKTAQGLLDAQVNHASDPNSIYYLPPADVLMNSVPGMKDSPLAQKVLAPLITAKVDLSNPNAVAQYTVSAIKEGKITANQAATDIATLYGMGQTANIASKQVMQMGLTPTNKYIGNATAGGTLQGNGDIDYADRTAVLRNLMSRMRMTIDWGQSGGRIFD